jgi:hypothetical protein
MTIETPEILQLVAKKSEIRTKNNIYREVQDRLSEIGLLAALGRTRKVRKKTWEFLTNHNSKVWGLCKSGLFQIPLDDLNILAASFDLRTPFPDQIKRYNIPKSPTKSREVCLLGAPLFAAHTMLSGVITAQTLHAALIYSRKGFGRDALIQDALRHINDGHTFVSALDIKNCFPNINAAVLDTLPVHACFLENTLKLENLNFATTVQTLNRKEIPEAETSNQSSLVNAEDITNTGAPTGLVQGSPASWPILSWALKDLPIINTDQGFILIYVDDILVVAKSADAREEIENAVASFLRGCPAGPLELVRKRIDPGHSFDFLGYEINYCPETRKAEARMSHRTLERLERNLSVFEQKDKDQGYAYPSSAIRHLEAVVAGHPLAEDADEWESFHRQVLLDFGLANMPWSNSI